MLSASLGVRSLPVSPESSLVETVPLLSPTTEKKLLKDSWIIPELYNSNTSEESIIHSIQFNWEENYQDLSDWCIDSFHNQCELHLDDSETMMHSGMNIGDISMSKEIVGDVIKSREINNESTNITKEESEQNISNQTTILSSDNANEIFVNKLDVPDQWLNATSSTTATRTDAWVQLIDTQNIDETSQQMINVEDETKNLKTIHKRQTSLDIINTDTNAFDLLSYLCDDDIQSSNNASMKSTAVTQEKTSVETATESLKITPRLRGRRRVKAVDDKKSSTTTSSSVVNLSNAPDDSVPLASLKMSKRHSTTRTLKKKEVEAPPHTSRSRKRTIDTDSDDHSSNYSYKESREKNNEASRKSRMNKKTKEQEMMSQADELERNNKLLKMKVKHLDNMVTKLRAIILQSALSKRH